MEEQINSFAEIIVNNLLKNCNRLLDFIKKADKKPLWEGKGAVIYTRVSSKEQADNNTSLDTQKRFCEEYCLRKG